MSILRWVIFGLVAGLIARLLNPGYHRLSLIQTIVLGILGSIVGGALAYVLRLGLYSYQPAGWIFSIVGAMLLLWMGVVGARPRGPH